MDELIDIITPEGKPTGKTALKSEAHKNGWFHATAHIWLFTADKKILLQKRSMTKKVFPGLWDISVAGHVGAGETILTSAKRELFEEIGLQIEEKDLIKIGTRVHQITHKNGIKDNEYHHVFIAELKTSLSKLTIINCLLIKKLLKNYYKKNKTLKTCFFQNFMSIMLLFIIRLFHT